MYQDQVARRTTHSHDAECNHRLQVSLSAPSPQRAEICNQNCPDASLLVIQNP